ncbi:MAG: hypothetical protein JO300_05945 [Silvibacterium sp.]|nr:hypothetical protein [Silvibacterium sp.]
MVFSLPRWILALKKVEQPAPAQFGASNLDQKCASAAGTNLKVYLGDKIVRQQNMGALRSHTTSVT